MNKRPMAEVLKIVREYLWIGGEAQVHRRLPGRLVLYICDASICAHGKGEITREEDIELRDLIMLRIRPSKTLAGYLHELKMLPEGVKIPGGYNLTNAEYVKLREKWIDDFILELNQTEPTNESA